MNTSATQALRCVIEATSNQQGSFESKISSIILGWEEILQGCAVSFWKTSDGQLSGWFLGDDFADRLSTNQVEIAELSGIDIIRDLQGIHPKGSTWFDLLLSKELLGRESTSCYIFSIPEHGFGLIDTPSQENLTVEDLSNLTSMTGLLIAGLIRSRDEVITLEDHVDTGKTKLAYLDADLHALRSLVDAVSIPEYSREGFTLKVRSEPLDIVGGDFYWINTDTPGKITFVLLDSVGHGIASSVFGSYIINWLDSAPLDSDQLNAPDRILSELNRYFSNRHDSFSFTAWCGCYDIENHKLVFSSGGHPPALLFRETAESRPAPVSLTTNGSVLGVDADSRFEQEEYETGEKSLLYLFTDGLFEVNESSPDCWSLEDFISTLTSVQESVR